MRADRSIIVIGGFLSVIGLALAWNGYGYVELERGWSLLIAGTIGFCTGLVLVALGLVLSRLADIAASASRAALMLAKAKTIGLPEISLPGAPPARQEDQQEDRDILAKPVKARLDEKNPSEPNAVEADAVEANLESDWEPQWDPEEELERALAAEARKAGAAGKPVAEPEAFSERKSERPLAWTIRKDEKPAEHEPPVGNTPAPEDDAWLYRTISDPLIGNGEPEAPETVHIEEPAAEPPHEPHELAQGEGFDHETEKPPEPPVPAAPAASEAKSEVVGHYEAQGAHYTMYADGSIDAETVHGVYRFASMEELKRFIEGQE